MAAASVAGAAVPETSAVSLARLTLAAVTPGIFSSARWTRPAQAAQVMPWMGSESGAREAG